jgi:hypothetical protein
MGTQELGYAVQIVVGYMATIVMQYLKRASWFPWLNGWSAGWYKVLVSGVVAAISAAGISYTFDPAIGQLTVIGLTWTGVWHALVAFGVSFATQHLVYAGVVKSTMPVSKNRIVALFLTAFLALSTIGCAGTIRDRIRTSALAAGEIVLSVDQEEYKLYEAGAYGSDPVAAKAKHLANGAKIDRAILQVAAYNRAARTWPAAVPSLPTNVSEARTAALEALDELVFIFTDVPGADGVLKIIATVQAKVGT